MAILIWRPWRAGPARPCGELHANTTRAATVRRSSANWPDGRRWFCRATNAWPATIRTTAGCNGSSTVYSAKTGLIYITGGDPDHHILAIRPNGHGNVTQTHIVWRTTKGAAYVPSPIIEGDYFLIVSDSGVAHCLQAATGQLLWQERMGEHPASLVSANGLVYFLNDEGATHIVKPGPEFQLLAKNELGEKCFASPAISGNQIFIRGDKHLFCIGAR